MDEGQTDNNSGGLYETSPDFSPDFLTSSDTSDNDARGQLKAREEAAAQSEGGLYEGAKEREHANDKKIDNDQGGSDAMGAAKRGASMTGSIAGGGAKAGKILGLSKAALPIAIVVLVLIVGFAIFLFAGQGSFAQSFKTRMMEDWNTTTVSTKARTDNMINGVQLCGSEGSAYGDLAYANMDLSEEQIVDFEDAGFTYSPDEKTLSYKKPGGETVVITCDARVGQTKDGQTVAESGLSLPDAGGDTDYEAVKEEILANLGLSSEIASVQGFSEALKDNTVKEKYMIATRAYRGNMSSWFTPAADIMVARLGVSRDFFRDFEKTNPEADKEYVDALIDERQNSETGTEESLAERVQVIEAGSTDSSCGAVSAFNDIGSVTTAAETYKQIGIAAMYLESIDKTAAGYGTESPMASITNEYMRTGAAGSEYMQKLFGGKQLEQSSSAVKDISAQASGTDVNWSDGVKEEMYRSCEYIGDTTVYDNRGFISRIGSIFRNFFSKIGEFLKGGAEDAAGVVVAALDPQIAQYEKMKENKYWGDDADGAALGNGTGSVVERYFGEHSKSEGQDIGGTEEVLAFKRDQAESIAEEAWYDRQTKSPFDTSSRHTFLGSIAYSLMPLAVSTPSLSLTSAMSSLGKMVSSSVTSLLPTSSAVGDAELVSSIGDCVMLNSTTAIADVMCNPYYVTDMSLVGNSPTQAFEAVAAMRYDEEGTYIGGYAYNKDNAGGTGQVSYTQKVNVKRRSTDDPMYRDGPVNKDEINYEHHWPEVKEAVLESLGEDVVAVGEPRGCESNWYHETRYKLLPGGAINYAETEEWINFDWPIEWKYSRGPTNFEYEGYESGWPNVLRNGTVGQEKAVNDDAPGECVLDFKVNDKKLPVVNPNGALALYQIADGQRSSEWGVADNANTEWLAKSDFTLGRLHPCNTQFVKLNEDGDPSDYEKYCQPYIDNYRWGAWDGYDNMADGVAHSDVMSRWVSGTAYTMTSGGTGGVNVGTVPDNFDVRFQDPTRGGALFWDEQKVYQAFSETQEWLDSAGILAESPTTAFLQDYYNENPLDQSYAGILARYSGKSKEQVVAVLDLFEYMEFLANYDPTELYPLGPQEEMEYIYADETVIATNDEALASEEPIEYDELRNRTFAA